MNYAEYEEWIKQAAEAAPETTRLFFAYETVRALHNRARSAIREQLTGEEIDLIAEILESLEGDPELIREKLEQLDETVYQDPTRKIKYIPDLLEFLCSLAHYVDYRSTGNAAYIAAIGLNIVNVIDCAVSGQVEGYSINDILKAEEMVLEFERQQDIMIPDDDDDDDDDDDIESSSDD